MNREELLKSPVFWTTELQMELYRQIDSYMQTHSMNKAQLAAQLGCTKSYVSQLLAGNFDHKMSKFFELTLAIGKIPEFTFHDVDEYIEEDIFMCHACYKKMFGDPPLACSSMYT